MIGQIVSGIFGGGGMKSIENIASEWIETDLEKAEAKTVMLKTLDPNGMMRRGISRRVGSLYSLYIVTTLVMLFLEFGFGLAGVDVSPVSETTAKITDLFTPITTLFGVIVSASFGVNAVNAKKAQ